MISFELVIEMATPFVMRHRTTLDALLSAAVFNMTGLQGKDTVPHIPLHQDRGIFKGSSLMLPRNYRHSIVDRVMALRGEDDLSMQAFSPNNRGKRYSPVDRQRGPYKSNLSAYPAFVAKEVSFFGVGDPESVARLVRDFIPGLGKRATGGAGEIIRVEPTGSEDYSWMDEKGNPARPLPVDLWREIGGRDGMPTAPLAVTFPYWESDKVEAVFPL